MSKQEFPRFKVYDWVWVVYSGSIDHVKTVVDINYEQQTYALRDEKTLHDTYGYKQENIAGSFYEACKMIVNKGKEACNKAWKLK